MKKIGFGSSILILAVLLVSGILYQAPQPIDKLSIALARTPLNAPFYVAQELGLFAQTGLQLDITEVIGGIRSYRMMLNGNVDLATSSESVLAFAALREEDFRIISSFVQSENDIKIVAHPQSSVEHLSDLKAKKVAYVPASASEYFLSLTLALGGLSVDDIEAIDMAADKMPEALRLGEVDAISVWEPFAFEAVQSSDIQTLQPVTRGLHTLSFNLVSSAELLENKPEALQALLQALREAAQYIAQTRNRRKGSSVNGSTLSKILLTGSGPTTAST